MCGALLDWCQTRATPHHDDVSLTHFRDLSSRISHLFKSIDSSRRWMCRTMAEEESHSTLKWFIQLSFKFSLEPSSLGMTKANRYSELLGTGDGSESFFKKNFSALIEFAADFVLRRIFTKIIFVSLLRLVVREKRSRCSRWRWFDWKTKEIRSTRCYSILQIQSKVPSNTAQPFPPYPAACFGLVRLCYATVMMDRREINFQCKSTVERLFVSTHSIERRKSANNP